MGFHGPTSPESPSLVKSLGSSFVILLYPLSIGIFDYIQEGDEA
jgi:hypothetical protein